MRETLIAATALATAFATWLATAPAASAKDGDAERTGACSGSANWKLKVGPEDRGLDVG